MADFIRPDGWLYLFFVTAACLLVSLPHTGQPLRLCLLLILLVGTGAGGLKIPFRTALTHAFLILEIMQLSWGISDSVTSLAFPFLHSAAPSVCFPLLQTGGILLALTLFSVCCLAVYRYVLQKNREAASKPDLHSRYFFLILTPLFLIFLISWHIIQNLYGSITSLPTRANAYHLRLLGIQLLAAASIFAILYAWHRLIRGFEAETGLRLMEQQNLFLQQYVEEARVHEQKTRALHHDMRNHLTVIRGFLAQDSPERADAYIASLDIAIKDASFVFRTGRAVVDILLGTKLADAQRNGILADCSLQIPPSCRISDMDLCILLANALDNALHACEKTEKDAERFLRLSSRSQGDFLLLQMENSFDGSPDYSRGTGLDNIRRIAEKYGGLLEISVRENIFCLRVLIL